jgi:uncharacterized membrane protein
MRNPLQNEDAAFRLVLGTCAYLAPIVVAAWIATWLGVVVFVVATVAGLAYVRRGTVPAQAVAISGRAAVEDTRRILVVANETVDSPSLLVAVGRVAEGGAADVLVVCPVGRSSSRLADERDHARTSAEARLGEALEKLRQSGVNARGEMADSDPLAALEGALLRFAADEVVISTHPPGRSPWLEQGILGGAGSLFDGPVTHVHGEPPP